MPHSRVLGCVGSTLVLLVTTVLLADQSIIYVDPAAGRLGASGDEGDPLGALRYALERVEPGSDTTIVLAAGSYDASREEYPIELPTVARSIRVLGSGGAVESRLLTPAIREAALTLRVDPHAGDFGQTKYEFESVVFVGGRKGLSVVVASEEPEAAPVSVDILDCTFKGQKLQSIEVVAGSGATVQASVRNCDFEGSTMYAIDLGTGIDGRLEIDVSRNRLESVGGAGAFPLRVGISVFVDSRGALSGRIDGNWLLDPTIGVAIATSSNEDSGVIDLDVMNNMVAGTVHGDRRGLRHGLQLNVVPGESIDLQVSSNTFADGSGAGVALSPRSYDEDACSRATFDFRENVVMGLSRGFVDWTFTGTTDIDDEERLIPECFRFVRNGVGATGGLPVPGSFVVSPSDFIAVERGDYRPVATSSLVDAGAVVKTAMDLSIVDADGNCRVADGDGDSIFRIDVGAFEFATETTPCAGPSFVFFRGDCNMDGRRDISDPITVFDFLFTKPIVPECLDACDSNDDGGVNISDGIALLSYLFREGAPPPAPFVEAGFDPTPDPLGCAND